MSESLEQEIRTLRSLFWSERDPEGRVFAPLADAYLRAGEPREALDLLTDGTARHPDFASGHVIAARLYLGQGMFGEAEIASRRVLELDAENVIGLESLARALEATGRRDEAQAIDATLAELDPQHGAAPVGGAVESAPPGSDGSLDIDFHDGGDAAAPFSELAIEPEAADEDDAFGGLTIAPLQPGSDALSEPTADTLAESELGSDEPELAIDVGLVPLAEPEPVMDLDALAPDAEPEPVMDLDALAPDAEPEAVMDLDALAPDAEPEAVMDLDALAPDAEPEAVMDLDALAPDAEPEAVIGLDALAPDAEPEAVIGLDALAPDAESEAVMDLDALAPDAESEPVMDLDALAPDAEPEAVMDLDALAPDAESEAVIGLDALAPDAESEPVMDLDALAPDAEPEAVMDLDALAPDAESEAVIGLDALAPDAEPEAVIGLDALAPDAEPEAVIGLDALAPGEAASAASDSVSAPVWTRTLAELYVKQGFEDKALEVLRHLRDLNPGSADIGRRIEEIERGDIATAPVESAKSSDSGLRGLPPLPDLEVPDEAETSARELAEGGLGEHEVDTPFTWIDAEGAEHDESAADGPRVGDYFERLLSWERPESS